jgi:hypothetical protein
LTENYKELSQIDAKYRQEISLNEAKLIEGITNLNSYFKKIYESVRYGDIKTEIEKVIKRHT